MINIEIMDEEDYAKTRRQRPVSAVRKQTDIYRKKLFYIGGYMAKEIARSLIRTDRRISSIIDNSYKKHELPSSFNLGEYDPLKEHLI
jgi:hypothetical protein